MAEEDPPGRESRPVDGWPPDFERLVIPDDARELDLDARALARERRAAARTRRVRRLLGLGHGRPAAASVGILITAAVLTVTSVVMLLRPTVRPIPDSVPLATGKGQPDGTVGGLLPDLKINREGFGPVLARGFRPAVIVLIPVGGPPAPVLHAAADTANKHNLYVLAVSTQLPELPADLSRSNLIRAADPDRGLLSAYRVATTPVLLLVRANGIVAQILTDNPPTSALDAEASLLAG
ncbi:MAG: hypothetical protein HYR62_08590 [Actinobacteria bacterium]|nr:hypothetical protein [Actinomycetota bacterium]MBI3687470.1 hypothetical protein [Actinomycetota bacterium]